MKMHAYSRYKKKAHTENRTLRPVLIAATGGNTGKVYRVNIRNIEHPVRAYDRTRPNILTKICSGRWLI